MVGSTDRQASWQARVRRCSYLFAAIGAAAGGCGHSGMQTAGRDGSSEVGGSTGQMTRADGGTTGAGGSFATGGATSTGPLGGGQGGSGVHLSTGGTPATTGANSCPRDPGKGSVNVVTIVNGTGGCANACSAIPPSTALCSDGSCLQTLAAGQTLPGTIAVDDLSVYWTSRDDSTVMKVPRSGGVPTVLASCQSSPYSIAVDAASVYWTTADAVMRVPLGGGTPSTLAAGQVGLASIAADGSSVYWVTTSGTTGSVMKVTLHDGVLTTLASGQDRPTYIAVDATSVYWATSSSVMKVALGGGTPSRLADASDLSAMVVDATSLYYTAVAQGIVMKVPLDGSTPAILASNLGTPRAIAVDANSVYWADRNTVMKVPVGGGTPAQMIGGQIFPYAIAVMGASVYWLNYVLPPI